MSEKISSIDQKELIKFNKTYQEWWNPEGEFKILHKITPIRGAYIKSVIEKFGKELGEDHKNFKIIDVGCGGGLICNQVATMFGQVVGLDANESNILAAQEASKIHGYNNINYLNTTLEEYLITGEKFHIALCLEVVEHVANIEEFLQNLTKLLVHNGILIISTINRTLKSYFLAKVMAEYVLKWVAPGTHDYNKFIKPSELNRMLTSSNLELIELKGLTFSILDQNWYLSDDIEINYFAVYKSTKKV